MQNHTVKAFALTLAFVLAPVLLQAGSMPGSASRDSRAASQDASRFSLQGKINKVEAGKFTVNTEDNILFHVRYDDKTAITRADGSAGSSKDLRAGVVVQVEGDLEESGEIAATTIKLQEKEPPKK